MFPKDERKRALQAALPIMLGYVAIGIPCGILSASIGLDVVQVLILSVFFYSGAGQFMIPNMFLAGAGLPAIIVSVSLVNLRQMLYSASLAPYTKGESLPKSLWFAATVTDESYGVGISRFIEGDWSVSSSLMVNLLSCTSWSLSNAVGVVVGGLINIPLAIASFAMTSIFICLLFTQKATRENIVAAVCAVIGVIVSKLIGLSGAAIVIGAVIGVACALVYSNLISHRPTIGTGGHAPAAAEQSVVAGDGPAKSAGEGGGDA